jgi:hypothetical protein
MTAVASHHQKNELCFFVKKEIIPTEISNGNRA